MKALEFFSVSKSFTKGRLVVDALSDVTFDVEAGEVFGFVGPNGAGKSTTIKVMLNIIDSYQGDVRIFGESARSARARRRVAYVPEAPALYEQLTPLEMLRIGMAMYGPLAADWERVARDWLSKLSVGHTAKRKIKELSKGTVQRVALAHALAVSPRLLILDEPLSGLDPIGRRDVVEILADFRKQGGTIFLTSHVLHDVERLADRFGLIHQGRLRAVRSPSELIGDDERVLLRTQGEGAGMEGMTAEPGGRWVIEVARSELWPILRVLESAGHAIVEVRPVLSLESAFLRAVTGDVHSLQK